MIPIEKAPLVSRGLREAFGVESADEIRQITKGLSADLTYRIGVKGSSYILRVMMRMDERNDPVRIFATMVAAAKAGLAPGVRYANSEDGISITDFVVEVPLTVLAARQRVPQMLRSLHSMPPLSKSFQFVTMHNAFVWRFRKSNLVPAEELEEGFGHYARLTAAYPRIEADLVSCHNDLKPENILFDGERLWLVDWQAAFTNDRYFDLAIVANFLANEPADEKELLGSYFGRPAEEYELARFYLMRQALHLMYATVFLMLGTATPGAATAETIAFDDFHRRIWEGKIQLAAPSDRTAYGTVHWRRYLENVRQERFEEALRLVRERHREDAAFCPLLPTAP